MHYPESRAKLFKPSFFLGLWALAAGCATRPSSGTAATPPALTAKSGAQLWSDNCGHCHNSRSPRSFSQGEWDIVVHHMRLRATLTGEESRKIVAFLKASD